MPKPYPDPNVTSMEGIYDYAYTVTNGYISILFMFVCLIILFSILKSKFYKTSDSIALAAFLTLILCSFLWAMGFFAGKFLVILLVLSVGGLIWGMFEQ